MSEAAGEFDLIARLFAPLAGPEGLGLLDDAALYRPPAGHELVLTTDAHVAGVHFLEDEAPEIAARRTLRTNLSDLAAKGAAPAGYLLTLALPAAADEAWLTRFADGLRLDQAEYGVRLFGGDTVSTPGPAMVSITAMGIVEEGKMLRRAGARAGDDLYVTGTIGDGALGLLAVQDDHAFSGLSADARAFLADRFRLPRPRVAFGPLLAVSGLATAAADVSDGLLADAGHIARASGLAAMVEAAAAPLSSAAAKALAEAPALLETILTGGDDYEIVFTAPASARAAIEEAGRESDTAVTRIGRMAPGSGVSASDGEGQSLSFGRTGFRHR